MENPYFVSEQEAALNTAAGAINAYMAANSDQEKIPAAALAALPEVQALTAVGFDLAAAGTRAELLQRVKDLFP